MKDASTSSRIRLDLPTKKKLALEKYGFALCSRTTGRLSDAERVARTAWKRDRLFEWKNGLDEGSTFSLGAPIAASQEADAPGRATSMTSPQDTEGGRPGEPTRPGKKKPCTHTAAFLEKHREREACKEDVRRAREELAKRKRKESRRTKGRGAKRVVERAKAKERDRLRLEKLVAKFREERHTIERVLREQAERAAAQKAVAEEAATARRIAEARHKAELAATRDERRAARQKIHEQLLSLYGYRVWRSEPDDPKSPQEAEARHRYFLASEAAERARKREKIAAYNRDYRRRKRAEAFAAKQKLWTVDEWAAWQEKERLKAEGPGTPPWVLKEVVALVAAAHGITPDAVMERMLPAGGVDFVLKGAEAMGAVKMRHRGALKAAARALLFYLDSDQARLFDVRPPERHVKANRLLKGN